MNRIVLTLLLIQANFCFGYGHNLHAGAHLTPKCQTSEMDNFFKTHFASIETTIQKHKRLSADESRFVYLVSYLLGSKLDIDSYSGIPNVKPEDIFFYKKFYIANRNKIQWSKIVDAMRILNNPALSEQQLSTLDSLKLK
jgi:hypothetical protein